MILFLISFLRENRRGASGTRDVLKRRLIDGLSYDEFSVEFHLSIRQVKNIVYKSQDRLFNHIR